MVMRQGRARRRDRGSAVIEVSLMAPWIFFLFLGVIDLGFYWYAAIATENAARVGAFYASQSSSALADTATVCAYALQEAKALPGLGSVVSCGALPFKVVVTPVTGPETWPNTEAVGNAANVPVTYQTP